MTNKLNLQAVNPEVSANTADPFDPANLRLDQSFTETVGVKKLRLTIPVRKPSPQDFVRVHPDPAYRENFPIIELKDEREEYIVTAALVPELANEFVTKTLFTAINRQGTLFLWPVRLPPRRRQEPRVVALGARSCRDGDVELGACEGQHEHWRL